MSGVTGFDNSVKQTSELYRRNIEDNRRNHKEEVENLKKSHDHRIKQQSENHSKQLGKLEVSHKNTGEKLKNDQKRSLIEKSESYDKALAKNKNEFHEMSRDNIRTWNKKFGELQGQFRKNMSDVKASDKEIRDSLADNYKENVRNIRKTANKELDAYVDSTRQGKKETSYNTRLEKEALINSHEKERNAILKSEMDKRNFLKRTAISDVQDSRNLQTKRYIDGKNLAELKFNKMNNDVNDRIDSEIIQREDVIREKQVAENKNNNIRFSERYDDLSNKYDKSIRDIEYRKRVEAISDNEASKKMQDNFKDNLKNQVKLQQETQINERNQVEKRYSEILDNTVSSFQNSMREQNIANSEKVNNIEANLSYENRREQFKNKQTLDKLAHDHSLAMKYVEDKNSITQSDTQKTTNQTVKSLKENFNKSLESAQVQSKKNFEMTQSAMLEDKRLLEKRLHDQNSKQNAQIKDIYVNKIERLSHGYEKKIQGLELQNEMIIQNSHDALRDTVRASNNEMERQRKAFGDMAQSKVEAEQNLSKEKENALNLKIKNLEKSFTNKMNQQTILNRKRLKDVTFNLNQKARSEATRYQDIIAQNQKFMAREVQRLKIASDTDRQRIVTQYEDRIQQLQKVYKQKTDELKNYNDVSQA